MLAALAPQRNPLVVVVDDDDRTRMLIRDVTREAAPLASIVECSTGVEALERIESEGADLLITDYHLVGMDGLSLVKALRAEKGELPIIMVSGDLDAQTKARSAGVDQFISKCELVTLLLECIPFFLSLGHDRRHCPSRIPPTVPISFVK